MPEVKIQGASLAYEESDVINFAEGLIGLPRLRRMVLVKQTDVEPFLWLVPLDDERIAFLVVDPRALFPGYAPSFPAELRDRIGLGEDEKPLMLSIVVVGRDLRSSTVNLRAPLIISPRSMRGTQVVLTESDYRVDHPLPVALAA
ncbi:MAG: flagellar assembly protein FliW [Pyrinomonas methylaliphatogenes]|nr:flagellar assembly protein FliW [Pyrinomonas methylaliphatogenes]